MDYTTYWYDGDDIFKDYPEYEDVRRICEKQNAGFTEVYRALAGEKKEN